DFLIAWHQQAAEGDNDRSKYLVPASRLHPMTGRFVAPRPVSVLSAAVFVSVTDRSRIPIVDAFCRQHPWL
ncbi:MAG: hypothetical protein ACKN81_21325, partial [Pirellulaceae bacterium]